ncbi:hypothetical protein ACFYZ9_18545 [Streptomyces sp. NPDC001691]|uniref:hypothetical protein n=1 Tax=Streptomyces sp. NPDC001691 TaxID=3364600 RepID=UPI00368D2344
MSTGVGGPPHYVVRAVGCQGRPSELAYGSRPAVVVVGPHRCRSALRPWLTRPAREGKSIQLAARTSRLGLLAELGKRVPRRSVAAHLTRQDEVMYSAIAEGRAGR